MAATQTELRRAVSCTYYALFHTLAASNANQPTTLGVAANLPGCRPPTDPEQTRQHQLGQQIPQSNSRIRHSFR